MAYISFQPNDYFNTKLWTGNSTNSTAITGVGFQPDMTWIKNRSQTDNHAIFDAIRGATYRIYPNATDAQIQATNSLASFDSDGFTLNDGGDANGNGENIVGWNWKANGTGSANTDGTISSTVSASTTSGMSIVKYTGTGANATVGHGLGVAPKMIIVKNLDSGLGYEWMIGHSDLASGETGFSANWYFNGFGTGIRNQNATASWNSTSPTNSVFSLHSGATYMNASGEANIAYCFAEKKGFSKFGSYVGNGEPAGDAPFIYTGFKPAFLLIKSSSYAGQHWSITDNRRLGYNGSSAWLKADSSGVELTNLVNPDLLSNGFKLQNNNDIYNKNGQSYIFMAFAEEPLVSSNGVPATAR